VVDVYLVGQGLDFPGYHFERTRRRNLRWWVREKSMAKLRESVRELTRRGNGNRPEHIISKLNRIPVLAEALARVALSE
jgi:hypothetical protein